MSALPSFKHHVLTEAAKPTVQVIALPKAGGKALWRINNDVYRADANETLDVFGTPQDKRWECSFDHLMRYWNAIYAAHYTLLQK